MIGGFVAFILTVLIWPFIAASATTPRWGFLAIVAAASLFFIRIRLTTAHVLFMLMLGYGALSLLWTDVQVEWWANFAKLFIAFAAFLVAAELKSIRGLLIGASLGLTINSAIVYMQVYGWHGLPQVSPPAGLWMNKDMGAEFAALVALGLVYERMWWFLPFVLANICQVILPVEIIPIAQSMFSNIDWAKLLGDPINIPMTFIYSRGALVSFFLVLLIAVLNRYPRLLVSIGAVIVSSAAVYYLVHFEGSVIERLSIWLDTIDGLSWFGHGLGSYYVTYPDFGHRVDTLYARPEHAHNDLLEFIYEMGIGAVLPVALSVSIWRASLATEKAIFLGFMVESMFSFPLHMPATAACFGIVAGRCAGSGPALRDDINDCRAVLRLGLDAIWKLSRGANAARVGEPIIPARVPDTERAGLLLRRNRADTDGSQPRNRADQGSVTGQSVRG